MKKGLRIAIIIILSAVFVVSLVKVVQSSLEYRKGASAYAEAEDIANIGEIKTDRSAAERRKDDSTHAAEPDIDEDPSDSKQSDPVAEAMLDADMPALREINGDVEGWILLPDTGISYPVVQGSDNDYYLDHNWKKEASSVGSVFLDCRCSADFTDFNTIIYGHRMKNGSMFAGLKYYAKQDYLESHPNIYIRTGDKIFIYNIYAAYEAAVGSITYNIEFPNDEARAEFIDHGLQNSAIDAGAAPSPSDSFITLITCTGRDYSSRWVVQAVLSGAALSE